MLFSWNQFPKDVWFDHDDVSDSSSFIEYLNHIVELDGTCTATTTDCNLVDPKSSDECKGQGSIDFGRRLSILFSNHFRTFTPGNTLCMKGSWTSESWWKGSLHLLCRISLTMM